MAAGAIESTDGETTTHERGKETRGDMMETAGGAEATDMLNAVRKALAEGSESVKALECTFKRCAGGLRLGEPSQTLGELTDAIGNLALLAELVGQLRSGLLVLRVEGTPFSRWQASAEAFQGMVTALEGKDWVFLSDLLEYEICPLMQETEKEMSLLSEQLGA